MEVFETLAEARMLIEQHRREYNLERPHSSLRYLTPSEFAATLESKDKKTSPREKTEESAAHRVA